MKIFRSKIFENASTVNSVLTRTLIPYFNYHQVLINVKYAGVNPVDTYIRSGAYGKATPELPFTPGYDGSGIVHQIGDQVTQVKVSLVRRIPILSGKKP